jgi:DNA gyrase subunit A
MATNMPPHNLQEVVNAIKAVAENPDISVLELMTQHIFGPDFPTGGYILGKGGIRQAYETGTGSITIRSKTEIIQKENGKKQIIITEIPYQVNKASMVEAIAQLAKDKLIEGITDIRDESNKQGIRVIVELRRDIVAEVVLNQLYKMTQLQVNFGIINLALVNGEPKVLSLTALLRHYIDHQIEVVERRTRFLLNKAQERDHIVSGYLIAIDNIDEVVAIIRKSDSVDNAKTALAERFSLSDRQTKEIVDMPLRRLTGMEKLKLEEEKADLESKIKSYNELLSDRKLVIATIMSELDEVAAKFSGPRVTEISNDVSTIDDEDLIPQEDIVIALTSNGYIKRMAPDSFKTQNRGGRGVRGITTHDNDSVATLTYANTHTDLLFFTNLGRVYRTRGYQVPQFSKTAKGLPIVNFLKLDKEEKVLTIISVDEYLDNHYLMFVTKNGLVKRTAVTEFKSIYQNGKIAISLREGDELIDVKHTNGSAIIAIASSNGKIVRFDENDARSMGRNTMGVKGINVDGGYVVGVTTSLEGSYIFVLTEKGYGKKSPIDSYRMTHRGSKGVLTIKPTPKVGNVAAIRAVEGDEHLMIMTNIGTTIKVPLSQISVLSRVTQGVRVIKLNEGESIASIAIVEYVEEDELIDASDPLTE